MKTIDSFSGIQSGYSLSKTIRNELIPVGKTLEHMQKYGFLDRDSERNRCYPIAKRMIDECHKTLIERVLSSAHLIWDDLADAITEYRKVMRQSGNKNASAEDKEQLYRLKKEAKEKVGKKSAEMRELIEKLFKDDSDFPKLFKKELFEDLIPKLDLKRIGFTEEERQSVCEQFDRFSTYFTGFHENRKNIYSKEEISTSVAYRLVHENFPRFLDNIKIFHKIKEKYPDLIRQAEVNLTEILQNDSFESYFTVDGFNKVMTQSGIEKYNALTGGISGEAGERKIQGLNELINLQRQQPGFGDDGILKAKMNLLYKQILSDRQKISFAGIEYENEKDLQSDILTTLPEWRRGIIDLLNAIGKISVIDEDHVYIDAKSLTDFSMTLFGQWNILKIFLDEKKEKEAAKEASKKIKNGIFLSYEKRIAYSVSELQHLIEINRDNLRERELDDSASFELYVKKCAEAAGEIEEKYKAAEALLQKDYSNSPLREHQEDIDLLKNWLDSLQSFYHLVRIFDVSSELDKDSCFYSDYDQALSCIKTCVPLYNKVRNFATRKVGGVKKIKMNFDCSTLADGWDLNKEKDNLATIFIKDGRYYLGIMNPEKKIHFEEYEVSEGEGPVFKKMVYKYLPGPNKMLPKVFFSKKGISIYNPPQSLLNDYNEGKHKKGPTFDLSKCHQIIDFFKDSIKKNPDWAIFPFRFSPTSEYSDISQFYREVSENAYKLYFVNIPEKVINEMTEDGRLFLFQIYNKDFAAKATGRKNLHTLYFENLFSEENLKKSVIKLNGCAELFYRQASIKPVQMHRVGEKLLNRTTKDGRTIEDSVYRELFLDINNRLTQPLSEEAKELKDSGTLVVKEVKHELIKDKRFTQDKFLFHCPITFNHTATAFVDINLKTRRALAAANDIKIIGLDRGERHLIYLSLIDASGKILKQKSFNVIDVERGQLQTAVDYHQKLEQKAISRNQARINWQTIGNIKELKEGFLSQVVHEIAEMMVNENAIVVMEDLNFGFKRGRFKVEQQVYQKFEKMLIDKLNYLVFKDRDVCAPGGVLNGYQLTAPFESFRNLGKQSGWIFYIPAWNTSKIDPVTGFINQFRTADLTNMEKKAAFFSMFDSILYNQTEDAFLLSFRYSRFIDKETVLGRDEWTISTRGKRILYNSKERKNFEIHPTEELKKIFSQQEINWESGNNILPDILSVPLERSNAGFFDQLLRLLNAVLQMRNSNPRTEEDFIISPAADRYNHYFDTRENVPGLPDNADANGAYNIARKGLWILEQLRSIDEKDDKALRRADLAISNKEWIEFVQRGNQ